MIDCKRIEGIHSQSIVGFSWVSTGVSHSNQPILIGLWDSHKWEWLTMNISIPKLLILNIKAYTTHPNTKTPSPLPRQISVLNIRAFMISTIDQLTIDLLLHLIPLGNRSESTQLSALPQFTLYPIKRELLVNSRAPTINYSLPLNVICNYAAFSCIPWLHLYDTTLK